MEKIRSLNIKIEWFRYSFAIIAIFFMVNQVLGLRLLGVNLLGNLYLYLILAAFLPFTFLLYPISQKISSKDRIPFYDVVLAVIIFTDCMYLAFNSYRIILEGWISNPPMTVVISSIILWIFILEALRRVAGPVLFWFVAVFSLYPLYAGYMPSWLSGVPFGFVDTAVFHALSNQSILGLPMVTFGQIVMGYITFGVILEMTGGGKYFIDLSKALLGHTRGGSAKMAIMSSAAFASLSGSAISNVLTTGSITIPAMKKDGYSKEFAGSVEACASVGGVLAPPVMGAAAFIMASIIGVPYRDIILVAVVPSILYYLALFIAVDKRAAVSDLKGTKEREESIIKIFFSGWMYLLTFLTLFFFIFVLQREAAAPIFASLLLLVLTLFKKENKLNFKLLKDMLNRISNVLLEMVVILAAVGVLIGALSATGMAQALAFELVGLAGNSLFLLVIFTAVASFILGLGLTVTAVYVFLSVAVAPTLIQFGVNPLAAHFFVLYCGVLSNITPPTALAVYAATSISGGDFLKTCLQSMRVGIMLYVLPFFFVLNPSIILQTDNISEIVFVIITAVAGLILLTGAFEGYLYGIGKIPGKRMVSAIIRLAIGIAGFLLMIPEGPSSLIQSGAGWLAAGATVFTLILYISLKVMTNKKLIQNNNLPFQINTEE
jgi:TRAP transporter 4TM/12TM fusion protein